MPEISLQAYEKEIDQLIEQARYLEALAHVRHLLGQYPHYVGAYYLLGKTMLEVDLPGLAVDMFRRALSANPEHLMARIGLGLAHERGNNLDASIWNLLRALELDPGNNDIGEELRRMYGRRDGLEPDYIPQTPAGLARLYIRGNRSGRAVAQLRALLEAEPARPDLMTALAEAYWGNGQIVQTSDLCQEILDKMPYNCKANLLLGTLWVNSGQEEGRMYLQRAAEIDPTNAMAVELFGAESPLEPQAVTLDRLVYDPDAIEVDQKSAWFKRLEAASVTAGISEAPPEMTESEMRLVDITAGLESQIEIPDWLRELGASDEDEDVGGLGWMADLGAVAAPDLSDEPGLIEGDAAGELDDTVVLQGFPEGSGLLEGEVEDVTPDWLQEFTPHGSSFDLGESEGAPDWLRELVAGGGVEEPSAAESETPAEDDSDWLTTLAAEEDAVELDALAGEAASDEDVGWLVGLSTTDESDEDAPEWLVELPSTMVDEGAFGTVGAVAGETEAPGSDDVPDWLKALEPAAEADLDAPEAVEDEGLPDWLSGLVPASMETEPEVAELEEEPVPDWLGELAPAEPEAEALSSQVATLDPGVDVEETEEDLGLPDWLADLTLADTEGETVDAGAMDAGTADWLSELTPSLDAAVEPSGVAAEEEYPDWLRDLGSGEDEPVVESQTVLESPKLAGLGVEEDGALIGADALSWLDSLTAELETEVASTTAAAEDETQEMNLFAAETDVAEAPPVDTATWADEVPDEQAELLSGDDALAWLESLAVGKEEELRAQATAESEARVAEILGRKPAVREADAESTVAGAPETIPEVSEVEESAAGLTVATQVAAESGAAAVDAMLEEESDLLSGADALAWLESLAVGKEDELRAQVEAESEARVAEILGRKRVVHEPEPALQPEADVVAAPVAATEPADVVVVELPATVIEMPADEEAEAPTEQGDLMSGDDALAWLQSLTAGKEDELRAQGETESAARVDEILGRRHEVPLAGASPTETESTEVETVIDAQPESPIEPESVELVADKQDAGFFGWSSFGDEIVEVLPTTLGGEERAADAAEPVIDATEIVTEEEPEAGEDALAWLSELSPQKTSELEALLTSGSETAVTDQESEHDYVGRSAPGGQPEEMPAPASEIAIEDEPAESELEMPDLPVAELEAVAAEPVEVQLAKGDDDPSAAVAEPIADEAEVSEELVMEIEPPAEPSTTVVGAVPVETETAPAGDTTIPAVTRLEVEPSAATAEALEEMRAYTKRKRSDHAARLALARMLWFAGEIQESMQHYGRLIKSGARSDEVMADLEQYVDAGPSNASVMRTLGDAHMKFGDLEKALEIYNRAMDLL